MRRGFVPSELCHDCPTTAPYISFYHAKVVRASIVSSGFNDRREQANHTNTTWLATETWHLASGCREPKVCGGLHVAGLMQGRRVTWWLSRVRLPQGLTWAAHPTTSHPSPLWNLPQKTLPSAGLRRLWLRVQPHRPMLLSGIFSNATLTNRPVLVRVSRVMLHSLNALIFEPDRLLHRPSFKYVNASASASRGGRGCEPSLATIAKHDIASYGSLVRVSSLRPPD
ncbi:hypothetical protein ANO11243_050350 [Dothideomycetidae sp. 11243]|nr:hypothetical protein ANO11243_050350 [fungal sp. No.11243]